MAPPMVSQITHIRTERLVGPRPTKDNQERTEYRTKVNFSQLRLFYGSHFARGGVVQGDWRLMT
jgi:hypothetical protein